MAKQTAPKDPSILALHMPPIAMGEVTADTGGRGPVSSRRW